MAPSGSDRSRTTRVVLERGKTWTFATALDWPGWCRRGRGEAGAVETLLDYADRYAQVAGEGFAPGSVVVIGEVPGNATTDFGAPGIAGPWDDEPLSRGERARLIALVTSSLSFFDAVVESAPATLRKGPRGGGRDRDAVATHVREAERAYSAKLGRRIAPRTPWPEQRAELTIALREGSPDAAWSTRFAIRRLAWHVLDHAWEIEDRSP
jgi:hypothetical protein